jgi:hypothetical protein
MWEGRTHGRTHARVKVGQPRVGAVGACGRGLAGPRRRPVKAKERFVLAQPRTRRGKHSMRAPHATRRMEVGGGQRTTLEWAATVRYDARGACDPARDCTHPRSTRPVSKSVTHDGTPRAARVPRTMVLSMKMVAKHSQFCFFKFGRAAIGEAAGVGASGQ